MIFNNIFKKGLVMARRNIPISQKEDLIRDWELGLYSNIARLAKAHKVSYNTASSIVKSYKSIKGSRADDLEDYKDAKKEFILNPTPVNSKNAKVAQRLIPITNLFDMDAIEAHTNGLVAKEIMAELEEELIKSNLILINARANHNIRKNTKTISLAGGKGMGAYTTDVPLDSADLKNYVDLVDKSIIALGLAPRHAPKSDTNVGVQLNTVDENGNITSTLPVSNNIDSFYNPKKVIEG